MNAAIFPRLTADKHSPRFFCLLFVISFSVSANAQKNLIGVYGSGEWGGGAGLRPILGFTYERKFTNHFGIETGALLHTTKTDITHFGSNNSGVRHYFTNVPVLFKYYSNIVNIAAGPTLNLHTARGFYGGNGVDTISTSGMADPKSFDVGYNIKVSKSFLIKDDFVLEPEVYLGNRFEFKKPLVGVGASFKYRF